MAKRRVKGEGSVYRRKDGRVVGEYEDANRPKITPPSVVPIPPNATTDPTAVAQRMLMCLFAS